MPACSFKLNRDAFGRLVYTAPDGTTEQSVVPTRAFPLTAPDEGVALVGTDGHEVLWIDRLSDLDPAMRGLLAEELASREFMPVIEAILSVSSYATPCTWQVQTDRGETSLVLKAEDDIRRLGDAQLIIGDSNGLNYMIRDIQVLDKLSRRILDRFL